MIFSPAGGSCVSLVQGAIAVPGSKQTQVIDPAGEGTELRRSDVPSSLRRVTYVTADSCEVAKPKMERHGPPPAIVVNVRALNILNAANEQRGHG